MTTGPIHARADIDDDARRGFQHRLEAVGRTRSGTILVASARGATRVGEVLAVERRADPADLLRDGVDSGPSAPLG